MLEICCFDLESCLLAEKAGADRIELCVNKTEGGITPSFGVLKMALKLLTIPVHVMVRPRGGDFLYSEFEKEIMLADIEVIKDLGAHGIVCGALLSDGSIDESFLGKIMSCKGHMTLTFHRAFDRCNDTFEALETLKKHKVDRLLTSGQFEKAIDGIENLKKIVEQAGEDLKILVGSGVMPDNIPLFAKLGISEFHFSASKTSESGMMYVNFNFLKQENSYPSVSIDLIQKAKAVIEKL
jgi:copper homeostasis protein